MNSFKLLLLTLLLFSQNLFAQSKTTKTEHLELVTLDGLRWQELFGGADSLLVDDTGMVEKPGSLLGDFWHSDPLVRRAKLFPFVWGTLAQQGQVYGNRYYGAKVDTQNKLWFSYPGYNELLSGSADDSRIRSNDKVPNPYKTFLEYLNEMPAYRNKVMAFGGWDVFPFIINESRSGIPVNSGFTPAIGTALSETEKLLNRLQKEIRGPWESV
ncbi:MAG: phosphoglyceromutase, partial [Algoriphagus sp.]